MCKSTFLNLENSRQNFTESPLTAWSYFNFTPTTHSAVKKVSFIHKRSDTTWSSPKTTSFRKNLSSILLVHTYPPHLIIKNIKKALIYTHSNFLSQRTPRAEKNTLPIIIPISDKYKCKLFITTIHKNWYTIDNDATLSAVWPSKPLSAYSKSSSIHNYLVHSA